jgi:opacity protein-like surface antigen
VTNDTFSFSLSIPRFVVALENRPCFRCDPIHFRDGLSRIDHDFANELAKSQPEILPSQLNSIDYQLENVLHRSTPEREGKKMTRLVSKKTFLGIAAAIIAVGVSANTSFAQVEQPSRIILQGTGLFTKSYTDHTPSNEATNSGGLLVGYSYQFSKWFEAQGDYGYSRNTQNFVAAGGPTAVQADVHEATGVLVAHLPIRLKRVQTYLLGGGGAVIFDPTEKYIVTGAGRQSRGAFVYGGGANFRVTNVFAIRAEYRGLVYKIPDFGLDSLNLDKFTHLAQPSAGFVFRF